jgi:hypothetical protein
MVMENHLIIGIDPDTDKSGFSIFNKMNNRLTLHEFTLWDLFYEIQKINVPFLVRLEAGHKNKKTWHKGGNAMAKRVGSNNEIGRQIEKFCVTYNIKLQLVAPCGLSSVNHETFCKITGWPIEQKTNPEKRVAGLLCWNK